MNTKQLTDNMEKIKWNAPQYSLDKDLPIESEKHFKITCVGDGAVGKTSMLISYVHKKFPDEYVPTALDMTIGRLEGTEDICSVSIWDTAGREDSDRLRYGLYHTRTPEYFWSAFLSSARILLFTEVKNVRNMWVPEVRHHCPDVPVIVVACKTDLRNDKETIERLAAKNMKAVTYEEGLTVARQHNAHYLECSSRKNVGLHDVFSMALELAPTYYIDGFRRRSNNRKSKCILM